MGSVIQQEKEEGVMCTHQYSELRMFFTRREFMLYSVLHDCGTFSSSGSSVVAGSSDEEAARAGASGIAAAGIAGGYPGYAA